MTSYRKFAIALAHEAGVLMLKNFNLAKKVEWKADNSPLTETDTAINQLTIDRIKASFPDHSVLGEEGSFTVPGSSFTWVCDPIDGTIPFSTGIPISTYSLAVVENGVPILGVIYNPHLEQMYFAEKGKGATVNDEPIHVSKHDTLFRAHIECTGPELVPLLKVLVDKGAKVTRMYCITCPGTLVATGKFDAITSINTSTWDIAALKVIIEEAGGKVTDVDGNEQRYDRKINGTLISNGLLHDELLELARVNRASQT